MVKRRLGLMLAVTVSLLITSTPAFTQEDSPPTSTQRDAKELAARLLGFEEPYAFPDLTPLYEVGAEVEFWVGKTDHDSPTRITATLAAVTPNIYLWVEDGIAYEEGAMGTFAGIADQIQLLMRLRDTYGQETIIPGAGAVRSSASRMTLPDIDTDPHIFILYTRDLGSVHYVINPNDLTASAYVPGDFSNQHEMILLNTSMLPDIALDNGAYISILIRALFDFVNHINAPGQARWLDEALAWDMTFQLQGNELPQDYIRAYFRNPLVSLIDTTQSGANAGLVGGQKLFLDYASQRFGRDYVQALYASSGLGVAPINHALDNNEFIDPVSGQPVSAADLFADFVIANVLDAPFGDGRYVHRFNQLPEDQSPAGQRVNSDNFILEAQPVGQYGASYFYLSVQQAERFTVNFEGQPTTARLPFDSARAADDHFYWSGRQADQDISLTRAVDLSGVDSATLTFDTWFDLSEAWNYAYVMVSADDGQTWEIIGSGDETDNHNGAAYGPGLTGISSLEGPRPFPYVGIQFASDGMTVTGIVPDAPASETDMQVGDVIIGHDETLWENGPNIIALLADYRSGDTLNLYIQRGNQRLSIPLILGEHPERVVLPEPEWLTQTLDLSAFAGQEILLRFEYISLPRQENPGIAIDNIAIPEIDYLDDTETTSDWENNGWQQLDNQLEQNFLVQVLVGGTQTAPPSVRQLIDPADRATSGEWTFNLEANQIILLAISGLNDDTSEPAQFDLSIIADSANRGI